MALLLQMLVLLGASVAVYAGKTAFLWYCYFSIMMIFMQTYISYAMN